MLLSKEEQLSMLDARIKTVEQSRFAIEMEAAELNDIRKVSKLGDELAEVDREIGTINARIAVHNMRLLALKRMKDAYQDEAVEAKPDSKTG
jgi:hypothetical protein